MYVNVAAITTAGWCVIDVTASTTGGQAWRSRTIPFEQIFPFHFEKKKEKYIVEWNKKKGRQSKHV